MADANFIPDVSELKKHLNYDPDTGNFIRIAKPKGRAKIGQVAGYRQKNGYVEIIVCGLRIRAHRLAWLFEYGVMPEGVIDHINRDPSDNRISNLRLTTQRINSHNKSLASKSNSTGWLGLDKLKNGFRVEIESEGKRYQFGMFNTIEEAKASYLTAKQILHSGFVG